MLGNYLFIALRSFKKNKGYSLINISGLTLGITCALIIFLFVYDEFTYDQIHTRSEDIYRLTAAYHLPKNGGVEEYAVSGPAIADILAKDFPEIKQVVRIQQINDVVIEKGKDSRNYETMFSADSNIFKVFNLPFESGNNETALLDPNSLVISRKIALKYFNRTDVVGESLYFPEDTMTFKITGVMKDYPQNTHLKLDIITSLETEKKWHQLFMGNWWSYHYFTYLELDHQANVKGLMEKIRFISRKYIADQEDQSGYRQEYSLIPFSRIHLYSNLRGEMEANSKASYVYIFMIIGIFILFIACINFMNLATARSALRAKEIGLRKVAGAFRSQLITQFLGESFIMTSIATILSLIVASLALPLINDFLGKDLHLFTNPILLPAVAGMTLCVSLLAGSYPSIFLSAFRPAETLKGIFKTSSRGNSLRRALVVFQFAISIFLISGTLIVYRQLRYLRSINLGFDQQRMIYIPTRFAANAESDFKALKDELEKIKEVAGATLSSRVPGKEMGNNVVRIGWDAKAEWSDMRFLAVDEDFVKVYDMKVMEGRFFDRKFPSDRNEAFVLNESGVRRLGWKEPKDAIGQKLGWQDRKGFIIGVVKDFHFMSSNTTVEPFLMLMHRPWSVGYLSLKISPGDLTTSVQQVKKIFTHVLPDRIFEYHFLDQDFDRQYASEDRFMSIFTFFACMAIFIASLGLYGLAMFTADVRLKEMAVRKVLGATEGSLVVLLTGDFSRLVILALVLATPFAYWSMNQWLQSFPYHQEINWIIFIAAGAIAMVVALLTVAYQSLKAARVDPVKSLSQG